MTQRKPPSDMTETIFKFIVTYKAENGYPPTLTEISEGVYMSRSGVYRHLDQLEAQGRIWREGKKARGIRVLNEVRS